MPLRDPFDVIAFVEVPDLTSLSDLILVKIQNIEGIQNTDGYSRDARRAQAQSASQSKEQISFFIEDEDEVENLWIKSGARIEEN